MNITIDKFYKVYSIVIIFFGIIQCIYSVDPPRIILGSGGSVRQDDLDSDDSVPHAIPFMEEEEEEDVSNDAAHLYNLYIDNGLSPLASSADLQSPMELTDQPEGARISLGEVIELSKPAEGGVSETTNSESREVPDKAENTGGVGLPPAVFSTVPQFPLLISGDEDFLSFLLSPSFEVDTLDIPSSISSLGTYGDSSSPEPKEIVGPSRLPEYVEEKGINITLNEYIAMVAWVREWGPKSRILGSSSLVDILLRYLAGDKQIELAREYKVALASVTKYICCCYEELRKDEGIRKVLESVNLEKCKKLETPVTEGATSESRIPAPIDEMPRLPDYIVVKGINITLDEYESMVKGIEATARKGKTIKNNALLVDILLKHLIGDKEEELAKEYNVTPRSIRTYVRCCYEALEKDGDIKKVLESISLEGCQKLGTRIVRGKAKKSRVSAQREKVLELPEYVGEGDINVTPAQYNGMVEMVEEKAPRSKRLCSDQLIDILLKHLKGSTQQELANEYDIVVSMVSKHVLSCYKVLEKDEDIKKALESINPKKWRELGRRVAEKEGQQNEKFSDSRSIKRKRVFAPEGKAFGLPEYIGERGINVTPAQYNCMVAMIEEEGPRSRTLEGNGLVDILLKHFTGDKQKELAKEYTVSEGSIGVYVFSCYKVLEKDEDIKKALESINPKKCKELRRRVARKDGEQNGNFSDSRSNKKRRVTEDSEEESEVTSSSSDAYLSPSTEESSSPSLGIPIDDSSVSSDCDSDIRSIDTGGILSSFIKRVRNGREAV